MRSVLVCLLLVVACQAAPLAPPPPDWSAGCTWTDTVVTPYGTLVLRGPIHDAGTCRDLSVSHPGNVTPAHQ